MSCYYRIKLAGVIASITLLTHVAYSAQISGEILDALTGAPIQNAEIILKPGDRHTVSDIHGHFSIMRLDPGEFSIAVSARGYADSGVTNCVIRPRDPGMTFFKIPLNPMTYEAEITVTAKPIEVRFKDIMATEIPAELFKDAPGAMEDPAKKVQTLPGVVSESDFLSILYVRGGGADETMLFLDRGYLLNPYHLGGAFSVYFEELVDTVEFYTGGFPARYGNALSGILDVTYRSGDRQGFHGWMDISPISGKIVFEGPIEKGSSSFLVGARRSYWDFAVDLFGLDEDVAAPYFGDIIGKYTYFGSARRVSFEILYGQDGLQRFNLKESMENPDADPGSFFFLNKSRLFNLTWQEWLGPELSVIGTLAYSHSGTRADLTGTEPLNVDADIDFQMADIEIDKESESFLFCGGVQTGWATISIDSFLTDYRSQIDGSRQTGNENSEKTDIVFETPFRFQALWGQAEWSPEWERTFQVTVGARADRWDPTDEITVSPRVQLLASLTQSLRIRSAWGVFYQFPYNVIQTAPDFGNPDLRSQRAMHSILGLEGDVSQFLKLRIEGYYKRYDRSIVNHDSAEAALDAAADGRAFVNDGTGFAYGGEFFCQLFPWRMLDGWLTYGYGLTKVYNPLHEINSKSYYPLQDQKHTAHLVTNLRLFKNWTISTRLTYSSGRPETEVKDWDLQFDKDPPHYLIWVAQYGSLNANRLEPYFRMDVRTQYARQFSKGIVVISLDILNVTNQKNLYVYSYNSGDPPQTKPEKEPINNLPILPVLGVSYRF